MKFYKMKKILLFLFIVPLFVTAQEKMPVAQGIAPNLYINHTVASKENFYSIGRIYNVSPKDIAPFNNLQLERGLSLGQQLKVPLNTTNFFQGGTADADETFVPVYYAVKDKEGLYRVAINHGTTTEALKEWNKIKADAVKKGTYVIVGYLKVKKELSSLAKNGIGTSIDGKAVAVTKVEDKKAPEPKIVKEDVTKKEPAKAVIVEPVKVKDVKEDEPEMTRAEKKEAKKKAKEEKNAAGGSFKDLYEEQYSKSDLVETQGASGVFKSTSGWVDKKYYCLHNTAPAGTIVKVVNPVNKKFIFAKVLDLMPDIKQNEGLQVIISNAAADELGITENTFTCEISYSN